MKTRHLTLAIAAGTLAVGALTASTPAQAVDLCFGLTPTIVASTGESIRGTEGDDVILADGVEFIVSLGGDDAICATRGKSVNAGDGNDRVSLKQVAVPRTLVILGNGSDYFDGSGADDRVWQDTDTIDDRPETSEETADVILTRGGDDRVFTGAWNAVNEDRIELGSGDDAISLAGAAGSSATIDGGRGKDSVAVVGGQPEPLAYDLSAGTATLSGADLATIEDFENLFASGIGGGVLTVRGTSGPNRIEVVSGQGRVDGLGGDDRLAVGGCGMVARGGGGSDKLTVSFAQDCGSSAVRLYGGSGPDLLVGADTSDVLIGEAGRDTARGGKGSDTCRAEIERSCERS